MTVEITADRMLPADIHVVQGPHYAKKKWLGHPRVVLLERCYYRGDPEHISLGWMRDDGGRNFRAGQGKASPDVEDNNGTGSIFLADYSGPQFVKGCDAVRLHPVKRARGEVVPDLRDQLRDYRTAIGYGTTALVTAALLGMEVDCRDPSHILQNDDWLDLLPWADWSGDEIESGEAWEHLRVDL